MSHILLMEEILHHLGWLKPYKWWDKLPISTGAGFCPSTVAPQNCHCFGARDTFFQTTICCVSILHFRGWGSRIFVAYCKFFFLPPSSYMPAPQGSRSLKQPWGVVTVWSPKNAWSKCSWSLRSPPFSVGKGCFFWATKQYGGVRGLNT